MGAPNRSGDVADREGGAKGDDAKLGQYLRVLAVPNRLELLRKLQVPRALSEITLTPFRASAGQRPDRPMSRQAVQRHLAALQALGLVHVRVGQRGGRPVSEFVVNHARLFVLSDELRRLSLIRPLGGASDTAARHTVSAAARVQLPVGPLLIVANGPLEGTTFPLVGPGPWILGREKGLTVSIPYDPFVSKENARIMRARDAYWIETLAGARNGTRVNWHSVEADRPVQLQSGDAVGVGRTLLFVRGV
jgi:DNA-binding transcriptional ArsR family regulator